ncbi:MAG: nucleoside hydrolase [Anaerolineales bacterium]
MNKRPFIVAILSRLLLVACSSQTLTPDPSLIQTQTPDPVIFDTDMAHEDMFSALYLLSHPNVDLKAITVTGTGEVHCEPGVVNALGLVTLSDHVEIPVSCGREQPLAGNHEFPTEWRQAADAAYGVDIPDGGEPSKLDAEDLIIDIIRNSNEPVTIIAVGPMTNIAGAIRKEPGITSNIKAIYIMGGAVNVDGNVGNSGVGIDNQHAEWNIYIDPVAANIVFNSGAPVTLVPLDATKDVPITRKFYNSLSNYLNTPSANFVQEMLSANLDFVDSGGLQFWDTLTSAIFTDESIASFEEIQLSVVEGEGPDSGYTKPDSTGPTIRVATSAERGKFESIFLTILNWED